MADKGGPDPKLLQLKLKMGISNLQTTVFRNEMEIVESEGRITNAKNNIKSSSKAIEEAAENLAKSIQEHGDLTNG